MKMNAWKISIASILLGLISLAMGKEPNLPLIDLKEEWVTLDKKNYGTWKIEEFVDWGGCADGGSIAFAFRTEKGIEFTVLVASPNYWTDEDKEKKRQVIYLVESERYYLVNLGSEQEKHLLEMLEQTEPSLKENGRTSRMRVEVLRETIQSRKAADGQRFATPEEINENNNRPSPPIDPFAEPADSEK